MPSRCCSFEWSCCAGSTQGLRAPFVQTSALAIAREKGPSGLRSEDGTTGCANSCPDFVEPPFDEQRLASSRDREIIRQPRPRWMRVAERGAGVSRVEAAHTTSLGRRGGEATGRASDRPPSLSRELRATPVELRPAEQRAETGAERTERRRVSTTHTRQQGALRVGVVPAV